MAVIVEHQAQIVIFPALNHLENLGLAGRTYVAVMLPRDPLIFMAEVERPCFSLLNGPAKPIAELREAVARGMGRVARWPPFACGTEHRVDG